MSPLGSFDGVQVMLTEVFVFLKECSSDNGPGSIVWIVM